jgi:hypothetical protein
MGQKHRLGDRREHVRFEVSGQLWASLETIDRAVLRNIGVGGALVEARLPPGIRTPRLAHVAFGARGPDLNAIIRHVSPLSPDDESNRFLVGLEFLTPSLVERESIEHFIREWSGPSES